MLLVKPFFKCIKAPFIVVVCLLIFMSFGARLGFKTKSQNKKIHGVIIDTLANPLNNAVKSWSVFYEYQGHINYAKIDGNEYNFGDVIEITVNKSHPEEYKIENKQVISKRTDILFIAENYPEEVRGKKIEIWQGEKLMKRVSFKSGVSISMENNMYYYIRYMKKKQTQNVYRFDFQDCTIPQFRCILLEYSKDYKAKKIRWYDDGYAVEE